jgi:hypothetical protein
VWRIRFATLCVPAFDLLRRIRDRGLELGTAGMDTLNEEVADSSEPVVPVQSADVPPKDDTPWESRWVIALLGC